MPGRLSKRQRTGRPWHRYKKAQPGQRLQIDPAQNSSPERQGEHSHRMDDQEFYRLVGRPHYRRHAPLHDQLREPEDYYNYNRPRGALDDLTPYERLLAKKS